MHPIPLMKLVLGLIFLAIICRPPLGGLSVPPVQLLSSTPVSVFNFVGSLFKLSLSELRFSYSHGSYRSRNENVTGIVVDVSLHHLPTINVHVNEASSSYNAPVLANAYANTVPSVTSSSPNATVVNSIAPVGSSAKFRCADSLMVDLRAPSPSQLNTSSIDFDAVLIGPVATPMQLLYNTVPTHYSLCVHLTWSSPGDSGICIPEDKLTTRETPRGFERRCARLQQFAYSKPNPVLYTSGTILWPFTFTRVRTFLQRTGKSTEADCSRPRGLASLVCMIVKSVKRSILTSQPGGLLEAPPKSNKSETTRTSTQPRIAITVRTVTGSEGLVSNKTKGPRTQLSSPPLVVPAIFGASPLLSYGPKKPLGALSIITPPTEQRVHSAFRGLDAPSLSAAHLAVLACALIGFMCLSFSISVDQVREEEATVQEVIARLQATVDARDATIAGLRSKKNGDFHATTGMKLTRTKARLLDASRRSNTLEREIGLLVIAHREEAQASRQEIQEKGRADVAAVVPAAATKIEQMSAEKACLASIHDAMAKELKTQAASLTRKTEEHAIVVAQLEQHHTTDTTEQDYNLALLIAEIGALASRLTASQGENSDLHDSNTTLVEKLQVALKERDDLREVHGAIISANLDRPREGECGRNSHRRRRASCSFSVDLTSDNKEELARL
ncbi:hypothetical protein FRB94_012086 [Tulasnella sp. JGI-2019a]|nr:hypothetical protein FRB94_012086 [Tulasnella sp. JGI-2019a]